MVANSEPLDFKVALKEKVWREAIKEELNSIEKNLDLGVNKATFR